QAAGYSLDMLKTMSDVDQRDAIIAHNGLFTGIPTGALKGLTNRQLVRLALGNVMSLSIAMTLHGVLRAGKWTTEVENMHDNDWWRNQLITKLAREHNGWSKQTVPY